MGSRNWIPIEALRRMPKAELHRHLDGSVRVSTIIELAKEQGVMLPSFEEAELRKLISVDLHCKSLEDYLRGFEITLKVLQKPYALTRVMYEVCKDAVDDGVRYLEVRFSPILHVRQGMSLSSVMEAVVHGQTMAEYTLNIVVRVIVCGMRQLSANVTKDLAEIAWRYRYKGVAGFDLAGPEDGFSSKHHREAFKLVQSKCLNCTLHSGEAAGPESIRDAILYCGAHRIGHGTRLAQDPSLEQYVIDRRIALECCVTSNVQTKAVSELGLHPIRRFFDKGVIVVPCCDNTTVSSVTLSGEYELIQKTFLFTPEELLRLVDNGFSSAFITVIERQCFRAKSLVACVQILKEEGFDLRAIPKITQFEDIGIDLEEIVTKPIVELFAYHTSPTFSNTLAPSIPSHPPNTIGSELPSAPETNALRSEELPLDLLRLLPKADLHCRFDGSVSVRTVWHEVQLARVDLRQFFSEQGICKAQEEASALTRQLTQVPDGSTERSDIDWSESIHSLSSSNTGTDSNHPIPLVYEGLSLAGFACLVKHMEYRIAAKRLLKSLLQTPAQLQRAVSDVLAQAVSDGVRYLELVVRPKTHTKAGILPLEVLSILSEAICKDMAFHNGLIRVALVIYASTNADDPIAFRETAELAVCTAARYRQRNSLQSSEPPQQQEQQQQQEPEDEESFCAPVVAFGVFGDKEISSTDFHYYHSTFDYLKRHSMHVVMLAGTTDARTITTALHEGGASRISGAFAVHTFPRLMNHLAMQKIPIELNLTEKLLKYTEEIQTFADPIRLFIDSGIVVTLCSFRGTLSNRSRCQDILHIVSKVKKQSLTLEWMIS